MRCGRWWGRKRKSKESGESTDIQLKGRRKKNQFGDKLRKQVANEEVAAAPAPVTSAELDLARSR